MQRAHVVEKEEFMHAGLDCEIIKTDMGHWCGYVRQDPDSGPIRFIVEEGSDGAVLEPEVEVWGGITYGPDPDGWVGFDDAHDRSLVDHRDQNTTKSAVKEETQRLAEQIQKIELNRDG